MKLYIKHGLLFDKTYALTHSDALLVSRMDEACKKCEWGYDSKNHRVRRQFWLDMEILGKNYINKPFILKVRK